MSKSKRVLAFVLAMSIVCGTTSCKKDDTATSSADANSLVAVEDDADIVDFYDAESTARGFITSVMTGDFTFAKSCLYLKDGSFISTDDLEYVLRRTHLSPIVNNADNLTDDPLSTLTVTQVGGEATATIFTDTVNFDENTMTTFDLKLNDKNEWRVVPSAWVSEEFKCYVPEGVRFYLNDTEVPESYLYDSGDGIDMYVLPEVAARDYETHIVSSTFGEITGEITVNGYNPDYPEESDKWVEIPKIPSRKLFTEVSSVLKKDYNAIFKCMEKNKDAKSIQKYLAPDVSYKSLESSYESGLDVRYAYSDDGKSYLANKNCEILKIQQYPYVASYVYSDDSIVLNTTMSMHWKDEEGSSCTQYVIGAAKMVKHDGEWYIEDITDGPWTVLEDGLNQTDQDLTGWSVAPDLNSEEEE